MSIKLESMRNFVIKYNDLINCGDHYYKCDECDDLNFENCTFGTHLELLESLYLLQTGRV
jgi:hypothetical protein